MPHYCANCVLPVTRPGVFLGPDGICNGCRNVRSKPAIDWESREAAFRRLVEWAKERRAPYDCVVPVSGGKDSYWQVATCLQYGLHPLCVTYAYPGRTSHGEDNLRNLIKLGVDHFDFRVNPGVERRFIYRALSKTGIPGLVTHMALWAAPINLAVSQNIPLVIYGENTAFEYGGEDESLMGPNLDRRWLETFGVTGSTTAEDWVDKTLTRSDLTPFFLPTDEVLRAKEIKSIFLGHYFAWDVETSLRVAINHGFKALSEGARVGHYDYVNIDDDFIAIHHHPKWHKFGITRSWDNLSVEIRNRRMTRAQAISILRDKGDETPWSDIRLFCNYLGISMKEYFRILESFRNRDIWVRENGRWMIPDFLIPDFPWPEDPPLT